MGLDIKAAGSYLSAIDKQAFARVSEKIFNPNGDKTIDLTKLDLSKFNRVSLGTDLYSQRTNGDVALKAAKALTDFDVKLGNQFLANVQYLNSQAAQSILNANDLGQKSISVEVANAVASEKEVVAMTSQTTETQDLNKDKRGENPFSFYYKTEKDEPDDDEQLLSALSIFA